jgi:hypothetical protein
MRKERKIGLLRRFTVGLAVAALVAPAAQARVDELGGGATGNAGGAAVIKGDDKVILSGSGDSVLIHGDDKVIVPWTGEETVLIHGDDKTFAPGTDYSTLADYRRTLPQDYGDAVILAGDDKVFAPAPGTDPVLIHGDDKVITPQPDAVPVSDVSSPNSFDWSDAFIGAGAAFALMLLAGGAALGTRGRERTAAV